jgi:hypothetical protein
MGMANDRVGKNWQDKGLTDTPNEAILGTLAHYGIVMDEQKFKTLAQSHYPMTIASQWLEGWKGTGQFARFPPAAAAELWRRWEGDRLTPTEYAKGLIELMRALQQLLQGSATAPVGTSFKTLAELKPRVPLKDGKPDEAFVDEMFGHLDENAMRYFDELPESLARAGHVDDAQELADLESFLIRERDGLSRVMIEAATGDKKKAAGQLVEMVHDEKRTVMGRVMCVDALIHLEAYDDAKRELKKMTTDAETAKDWHLAIELCRRMAHVIDVSESPGEQEELEQVIERVRKGHEEAHPEHAHSEGGHEH